MAQGQLNQTISFGADVGQLKAALDVAGAQLKQFKRDLDAAFKAGDVAGVERLQKSIESVRVEQTRLQGELRKTETAFRGTNVAVHESTKAMHSLDLTLREMGISLGHISHAAGLSIEGIRALRYGFAGLIAAVGVRQLNEASKAITDLNQASKATGFNTSTIQSLGIAYEGVGLKAEDAQNSLKTLSGQLLEAQKRGLEAGETFGGTAVLNRSFAESAKGIVDLGNAVGNTVNILRGGQKDIVQFKDDFKALGIDVTRPQFAGPAGQDNLLRAIAQGLVQLNQAGKGVEANIRSLNLLGLSYRQIADVLEEVVRSGNLSKFREELYKTGALLTPEQVKINQEYAKSVAALGTAWEGFSRTIAVAVMPRITTLINSVKNAAGQLRQLLRDYHTDAQKVEQETKPAAGPAELRGRRIGQPGERFPETGITPLAGATQDYARLPGETAVDYRQRIAEEYRRRTGFPIGARAGEVRMRAPERAAEIPIGGSDPTAAQQTATAAQKTAEATKEIGKAAENNTKAFDTLAEGALSDFDRIKKGVSSVADSIVKSIGDAVDSANKSLQSLKLPSNGGSVTAPVVSDTSDYTGGYAVGGYIRGPGTSRSDSIFARLSNGEYVVNAASVRALGVGFMDSLNNFAKGGLVLPAPRRYAEGGLASFAEGGRAMASFHFESGSSYSLSGSANVVSAMVSEAHAQQIRSAGVKPSWFAGRPGGR